MFAHVWSGHHNVCLRASSSKWGRHRGKLFVECVTAEWVYCGRALQVWQRPKWTFPQQRHTEAEIQEGRRWSASSRIHLLVLLHTFRSTIFTVDKSPSKFCLVVVCLRRHTRSRAHTHRWANVMITEIQSKVNRRVCRGAAAGGRRGSHVT